MRFDQPKLSSRRAELAATELLFEQPKLNFYSLAHLDPRRLKLPVEVLFDSIGSYCSRTGTDRRLLSSGGRTEGMTVRFRRRYLVLYNENSTERRRTWTLSHELGHIMLSHSGESEGEEGEADAFAAALLAPLPALRYLARLQGRPLDIDTVCANFNISRRAASIRLRELDSPGRLLCSSEVALMMKLFSRVGGAAGDARKY